MGNSLDHGYGRQTGRQARQWGQKSRGVRHFYGDSLVRPALRFFASGFQHGMDFVIPPFFSLLSPSPCILLFPRWLARFYFSGFGYGVIAPFLLGEDDIGLRAMKLDQRITYITMMF